MLCESTDPNVTSNELCISWIKTLKAAWRPSKTPSRHQSIAENPVRKEEKPPSPDEPAPLAEVAFEEVTGFGDLDDGDGGNNESLNGSTDGGKNPATVEEEFGF